MMPRIDKKSFPSRNLSTETCYTDTTGQQVACPLYNISYAYHRYIIIYYIP